MGEVGIAVESDVVLVCDAALLLRPVQERRLVRPSEISLVVEVAETTLQRDLGMKRSAYAQADIPHYWVIDGERSPIHVFARPELGEFTEHRTVRFGEPLQVPGTDQAITIE